MELNFNRIPLLCIKFIYSGLLVKCGSAAATLCSHRSQPAATSCRNCRHCAAALSCRHCSILQQTHVETAATLCKPSTASILYSKCRHCSHIMHSSCEHCTAATLFRDCSSYLVLKLQPPYIGTAAPCRERFFIRPH